MLKMADKRAYFSYTRYSSSTIYRTNDLPTIDLKLSTLILRWCINDRGIYIHNSSEKLKKWHKK